MHELQEVLLTQVVHEEEQAEQFMKRVRYVPEGQFIEQYPLIKLKKGAQLTQF